MVQEQKVKEFVMKREKIVQIAITEDEMKGIILRLRTKEDEDGQRYTVSSYLREFCIRPHINGTGEPPQETKIETIPKEKGAWDDIDF
jgi:hypothetical protein